MENPVSPPKFRRTCPTCNRPVEPGYKFCETCGTKIPELSTCSKCGTRFIAPVKYCDLCGAPVILEVPEPADSTKYSEEEDNGQDEDQASERYGEEIPGPGTDELPEDPEETIEQAEDETPPYTNEEIQEQDSDEFPEDPGEEPIVPAENAPSHHTHEEIQEPDTDELLEQFGKEYDDDETLESSRTPKPRSSLTHEAKKPVRVHAPPGQVSSGTVDDVLFMSPGKHKAPAKPRVNRRRIFIACILLTAIIAGVYFIGLPMLTGNGGFSAPRNPPVAEVTPLATPVRTIPPAMTTTPVPAALRALVPLPTQLIPSGGNIYFQVQKNPVTSRIQVIFTGSAGQGSLSSADIKVTHPDGSVATGIIQPLKGVSEITLDGSKETDRVEIIAKMSSGETYRVRDELVPLMKL